MTSISLKMVTRKLSPQTSLIQPTEVDYSIEAARRQKTGKKRRMKLHRRIAWQKTTETKRGPSILMRTKKPIKMMSSTKFLHSHDIK